jgi:hypothetical protein
MNPQFFAKSAMGKTWEAQKHQPFGKGNLVQVYTTQFIFSTSSSLFLNPTTSRQDTQEDSSPQSLRPTNFGPNTSE